MALRQRNPRAPSPLPDGLGLRRHHEDAAREVAARFQAKTGGRNNYGRKTSRHRGAVTSSSTASSTSGATRTPFRRASRPLSTTRTGPVGSRCCTTSTVRSATSSRRTASRSTTWSSPSQGRHPYRQLVADALHPTGSTVHNVELRPRRRQDGAQRRHGCPDRRQRRCLRHTATSLDRDAPCPDRLSRHARTVGNSEHELTSIGKAGRNRWKGVRPRRVVSP